MCTRNPYFCICCGYVLWVHTYILWITRSSRIPTIYTWSSTIPTPQDICCHPQYVTHVLLSTLYTLVLHNMLPTTCDPQHIHMRPQNVPTTCRYIYILWVYIVGASVYVVDHIFHYVPHNIIVLSTIYTEPVYVVDNIPLSPTTYTHNIYKHPQYIPTIYTAVYIVGIYCGCLYMLWVYVVGDKGMLSTTYTGSVYIVDNTIILWGT